MVPCDMINYDRVIQTCLETVSQLVPVSASAFYHVNSSQEPQHYVLHNMSLNLHQLYIDTYQTLDPLRPEHFTKADIQIVGINQLDCRFFPDYYHEFMHKNAIKDITELFIRQQGNIIAGVTLLRDTLFTEKEYKQLHAILPLMQLVITPCLNQHQSFDTTYPYSLTEKERETVILLRHGASNKRIASEMGISLSTVKTHLRNIFAKTAVANRTELVSLLYRH